MNITKKQITYGALSFIAVAVLATAGAFALRQVNNFNKNAATQESTSAPSEKISITEEEAKNLLLEAEKARASGDYDAATSSYQKAQEYYKEADEMAKVAELDAALSLVEVEKKNTEAIVKPRLVGEK